MQEKPSNPDLERCPYCEREYSFIRCRVSQGGKSWCLSCPEKEAVDKKLADEGGVKL